MERETGAVAVSPSYEIVIPAALVKALNLQPGQQIQVIRHRGRLELIPAPPARAASTKAERATAAEGEQSPSTQIAYRKLNAVIERLDTLEAAVSALEAELAARDVDLDTLTADLN